MSKFLAPTLLLFGALFVSCLYCMDDNEKQYELLCLRRLNKKQLLKEIHLIKSSINRFDKPHSKYKAWTNEALDDAYNESPVYYLSGQERALLLAEIVFRYHNDRVKLILSELINRPKGELLLQKHQLLK